jgi:hypothetical protein
VCATLLRFWCACSNSKAGRVANLTCCACTDHKRNDRFEPASDHLHDVCVTEVDHNDASRCVSHCFNLEEFGDNGGESIMCERVPGWNVFDFFFAAEFVSVESARETHEEEARDHKMDPSRRRG